MAVSGLIAEERAEAADRTYRLEGKGLIYIGGRGLTAVNKGLAMTGCALRELRALIQGWGRPTWEKGYQYSGRHGNNGNHQTSHHGNHTD